MRRTALLFTLLLGSFAGTTAHATEAWMGKIVTSTRRADIIRTHEAGLLDTRPYRKTTLIDADKRITTGTLDGKPFRRVETSEGVTDEWGQSGVRSTSRGHLDGVAFKKTVTTKSVPGAMGGGKVTIVEGSEPILP